MDCREIVKKYLDAYGFDGLCAEDCGCPKDDLFPCESCFDYCEPAYKIECDHSCDEFFHCFASIKDAKCPLKEEV